VRNEGGVEMAGVNRHDGEVRLSSRHDEMRKCGLTGIDGCLAGLGRPTYRGASVTIYFLLQTAGDCLRGCGKLKVCLLEQHSQGNTFPPHGSSFAVAGAKDKSSKGLHVVAALWSVRRAKTLSEAQDFSQI
jgi:hypothetical protein